MTGSHRIIVESRKIKYDFVIKRNITILTGDSGSGKTVLIDLIRDYRRYGADSGVQVSCDCACRTIDDEDWERQVQEISGSIIFIDEGNRFLPSKRFAELVQHSDNYFVLATREKLPMLPYSITEIYGFRKSGRFHEAKQTYNELYHALAEQKQITCITANGKSNIMKALTDSTDTPGTRLIIADGAAFGSEMRDVSEYLNTVDNTVLYAPESFEWLLLSTNAIPGVNVESILQQPENYIDSSEYVSWERFFTDLLIKKTQDNPVWQYSKGHLVKAYLSSRVVNAVKRIMKLIFWD